MALGVRVLVALLSITFASGATPATTRDRDSRPLTASETATFLPLVCEHPQPATPRSDGTQCAQLIGYPDRSRSASSFGLWAIVYGSFTRSGSDEAYLTYYSQTVEPHAYNFGGGLLFARATGGWKLVRWYRGGQLDRCTLVPHTSPLRLLCASAFSNMGESDSRVAVRSIPPSGDKLDEQVPLLEASDTSGTSAEAEKGCYGGVPKGEARLLFIDSPKAWDQSPYFAKAELTYETAEDIAAACGAQSTRKVRQTKAFARFAERNGTVTIVTPIKFVEVR
jgi:hypothetical protein